MNVFSKQVIKHNISVVYPPLCYPLRVPYGMGEGGTRAKVVMLRVVSRRSTHAHDRCQQGALPVSYLTMYSWCAAAADDGGDGDDNDVP